MSCDLTSACRYDDVVRAAPLRERRSGARPAYTQECTQDEDWPRNPTHYFFRTLIAQVRIVT